MKVYEFGKEHTKLFVMFQCAVEPWWVFKASAEEMAKDYHVYLFIADGHDGLGTEFVCRTYPQTVLREFKGLAHAELVMMFPERFAEEVKRFLENPA